jgi:fatty-acyl-CoA synthase
VMKGYYKQPEETAKTIDADGWLHTHDIGYMDGDGYLVWTGRLQDMLHVGGENVSVLEIEKLLCTHPAVQAAAVVGIPDERLREVPAACVLLKPGEVATREAILDFCEAKVAGFKVPRVICFVAEFEMTSSGKIQKYALRDRLLAESNQTKS